MQNFWIPLALIGLFSVSCIGTNDIDDGVFQGEKISEDAVPVFMDFSGNLGPVDNIYLRTDDIDYASNLNYTSTMRVDGGAGDDAFMAILYFENGWTQSYFVPGYSETFRADGEVSMLGCAGHYRTASAWDVDALAREVTIIVSNPGVFEYNARWIDGSEVSGAFRVE